MNCCKKLDSIHKFASMAVKMQDKLKMLIETGSVEDMKEHSILHSILSKGAESESEVTEVEVRVDPMLFLCAFEDGCSDEEDSFGSNEILNNLSENHLEKSESSGNSSDTPSSSPETTTAVADTSASPPLSADAKNTSSTASTIPKSVLQPQAIQSNFSEKEGKPYCCTVCSRGFYNEIGLQNHLWSHLPQDRRVLGNGSNLERSVDVGRISY